MVALQSFTLLKLNEEYTQPFLRVSTSQLSNRQRIQLMKSLPLPIGASINAAKHAYVSSVVIHYRRMKL